MFAIHYSTILPYKQSTKKIRMSWLLNYIDDKLKSIQAWGQPWKTFLTLIGMVLNLLRIKDIYNISVENILAGNLDYPSKKSQRPLNNEECIFIRQVLATKHNCAIFILFDKHKKQEDDKMISGNMAAMVGIKWSVCLPSNCLIWVRIPLKFAIFLQNCCLKERK